MGKEVKQLSRGASQVSPHPENKTPRLIRSQPFITQPQEEEEEGGRGPGLQIIPEKGFKRYPCLSLLLNQPLPSSSVFESFPSNSLSLFLAEDKQRNSRTSVCLYSSNVIVLSSAEGKDFFITCLNIPSAAVWHAQQQLLCVIAHSISI